MNLLFQSLDFRFMIIRLEVHTFIISLAEEYKELKQ